MQVVPHPVCPQAFLNLVRRQHLRIDEVVQTHVLKELSVLGQQVFVVVDAGKRTLGA